MTDTELKLADSRIQLFLARSHEAEQAVVRSCLNAFVALGRSVTFLMQAESGSGTSLERWYRNNIAQLPEQDLLRFFNNRRVFTIHQGTIQVKQKSLPILAAQYSADGSPTLSPQFMKVWFFDGTDEYGFGVEPAFHLCERYLAVLEQLVENWLRARVSES